MNSEIAKSSLVKVWSVVLALVASLLVCCNGCGLPSDDSSGVIEQTPPSNQTPPAVGAASQVKPPGPPVDPPDVDMQAAAVFGDVEAVRQHIAAGSDLNEQAKDGSSPLITATLFGNDEVAKLLIEAGADVNFKNGEGSTPIHTAAFFCRTEIVVLLLQKGAEKNVRNNNGVTPLESVTAPYEDVVGVYKYLGTALGKLGLEIDHDRIKATRPKIAQMLQ